MAEEETPVAEETNPLTANMNIALLGKSYSHITFYYELPKNTTIKLGGRGIGRR